MAQPQWANPGIWQILKWSPTSWHMKDVLASNHLFMKNNHRDHMLDYYHPYSCLGNSYFNVPQLSIFLQVYSFGAAEASIGRLNTIMKEQFHRNTIVCQHSVAIRLSENAARRQDSVDLMHIPVQPLNRLYCFWPRCGVQNSKELRWPHWGLDSCRWQTPGYRVKLLCSTWSPDETLKKKKKKNKPLIWFRTSRAGFRG